MNAIDGSGVVGDVGALCGLRAVFSWGCSGSKLEAKRPEQHRNDVILDCQALLHVLGVTSGCTSLN